MQPGARGERHGSGRLDDDLHPFEDRAHRADDLVLAHRRDAIDVRCSRRIENVKSLSDVRRPSAMVSAAPTGTRRAPLPGTGGHRRRARARRHGHAHARHRVRARRVPSRCTGPPPPTGAMTASRSGHVFHQLQGGRALTRDDALVVVGVDEDGAGPLQDLQRPWTPARPASAAHGTISTLRSLRPPRRLMAGALLRHDDPGREFRGAWRPAPAPGRGCRRSASRRRGLASASPKDRTAFVAPRNLKAPTFWKFSHLKKSRMPTMAIEARARQNGRAMRLVADARSGSRMASIPDRVARTSRTAPTPTVSHSRAYSHSVPTPTHVPIPTRSSTAASC